MNHFIIHINSLKFADQKKLNLGLIILTSRHLPRWRAKKV